MSVNFYHAAAALHCCVVLILAQRRCTITMIGDFNDKIANASSRAGMVTAKRAERNLALHMFDFELTVRPRNISNGILIKREPPG